MQSRGEQPVGGRGQCPLLVSPRCPSLPSSLLSDLFGSLKGAVAGDLALPRPDLVIPRSPASRLRTPGGYQAQRRKVIKATFTKRPLVKMWLKAAVQIKPLQPHFKGQRRAGMRQGLPGGPRPLPPWGFLQLQRSQQGDPGLPFTWEMRVSQAEDKPNPTETPVTLITWKQAQGGPDSQRRREAALGPPRSEPGCGQRVRPAICLGPLCRQTPRTPNLRAGRCREKWTCQARGYQPPSSLLSLWAFAPGFRGT